MLMWLQSLGTSQIIVSGMQPLPCNNQASTQWSKATSYSSVVLPFFRCCLLCFVAARAISAMDIANWPILVRGVST